MEQARSVTAESERVTWDEICRRHVDQWVVLVDIDWGDDDSIEFGLSTVFGHAPNRKDAGPVVRRAFLHHKEVGCFFTGPLFGSATK